MKKTIRLLIIVLTLTISYSSVCQTWYTLDSLRKVYQKKQRFDTALIYAQKALDKALQEVGENDTIYANMLEGVSILDYYTGNYTKATESSRKVLEIRRNLLGTRDRSYASSLNNLANLYSATGNYSAALPLLTEAVKIKKEVLGARNIDYATSVNNLGVFYFMMNNYNASESLFLEALIIRKEVLGMKDPDYASTLNDLGKLYIEMGNYSRAENLILEALKIRKEVLGENNSDYALSLNNLGYLYTSMGNSAAAESLFIKAKPIWKEVMGKKHPGYISTLVFLGNVYVDMENYTSAESMFIEARDIQKEVVGDEHIDYALSLNNLGFLYKKIGNYDAAQPLFLNASDIYKKKLGPKHMFYATSLNNLAVLYRDMGNYKDAEPLLIESRDIYREALGENHIKYASSIEDLAELYERTNNYLAADTLFLEDIKITVANIDKNFSFLSEKEKENYVKSLTKHFNAFSDFAFNYYQKNPRIAEDLYNLILITKGILLNRSTIIFDEINNSKDTGLISTYKKWQKTKEDIGRYYQLSKARLKRMNINLDSIENLANTMEKEISIKSDAFSADRKNKVISWKQVQQKLGKKDAAIEFISYNKSSQPYKTKNSDTTYYCALVVTRNAKYPQMYKLCTGKELSALCEKKAAQDNSQVNVLKSITGSFVYDDEGNSRLYELLFKPLEKILKGKNKIYVSLSGLLNKIPINALDDDHNQLILNKYNLYFVNSTRQLVMNEKVETKSNQSIALFGGINYEPDSVKSIAGTIRSETNSNDTTSSRSYLYKTTNESGWKYLNGTLTEVVNIDRLFSENNWSVNLYSGNLATEEAFNSLTGNNSPAILHIATHGFFYPEPDSSTFKNTTNPFKTMRNPLWRSGIVLAGANYTWQLKTTIPGIQDGVLTAYEVSNKNLKNTDLVVLSACETGLGEIKSGEGVYGLLRAFQVAGAKAIIISLWQIPDKETSELMTLFYEQFFKTRNKHDSFRNAQQTLAKKYHPYYWAGFVMME